jgi:hypothetical protein
MTTATSSSTDYDPFDPTNLRLDPHFVQRTGLNPVEPVWGRAAVKPRSVAIPKTESKDFFFEEHIDNVVRGLNVTGTVWIYILQQWRMRKSRKNRKIRLSNTWLEKRGIDRFAKARALSVLEINGHIRVDRSNQRSPLVTVLKPPVRRKDV